jgi:hypothetical protein
MGDDPHGDPAHGRIAFGRTAAAGPTALGLGHPSCVSDRDPRDHDLQVGSGEAHQTLSRPCGHFPLRCARAAGTASHLINALASL